MLASRKRSPAHRWLLALASALTLLAAHAASANSPLGLETRVWGFDFAPQGAVGGIGFATPGMHQGKRNEYDEVASGYLLAARGGALAAKTEMEIAPRVLGQLADSRLGPLAGKISTEQLQTLATNPNALRFLDTASGHINTVQLVEGRLLRITTVADEAKIISVGPIQRTGLFNGIASGRFEPLIP